MTLSSSLVKSTIVAALGGLLFGFDTAVIAGTTEALTREYDLSPGSLGFTVASALVGTIVGALLASYPGDRLGRRDSLRIMAVLYFVSAIGCARLELVVARAVPVHRWPWNRRLVRARPDVHRGDRAGSFTHWMMNAIIAWSFPVIAAFSRSAPFVFFAAMMALQFFVVLTVYPETKGIALEDMDKRLRIH